MKAENETKPTTLNEDLYELQKFSICCDYHLDGEFMVHSDVISTAQREPKWKTFKYQSQDDIQNMYLNTKLDGSSFKKDLILECEDGEVECASLPLIARSDYYRMMLSTNHWMESSNRDVNGKIRVRSLDLLAEEAHAIINFCCSNELPASVELMSQLAVIADRMLMPSLSNLCQQQLGQLLANEQCPKAAVKAFPFALSYNSLYLARKCTQIIAANMPVLLETSQLDLLIEYDIMAMSSFYQEILDDSTIRTEL